MCGDNEIYRITINSGDLDNGTKVDGNYLIKLPYQVNRGMCYIEQLSITDAGTLFNTAIAVKVQSTTFTNNHSYETDGVNHKTIGIIPLDNNRHGHGGGSGNDLYYSSVINTNACGLPVSNFSLDNVLMNVRLTDDKNVLLTNAQLTDFSLTLVFVDYDPRQNGKVMEKY